mgnify:CR=1 FL=1
MWTTGVWFGGAKTTSLSFRTSAKTSSIPFRMGALVESHPSSEGVLHTKSRETHTTRTEGSLRSDGRRLSYKFVQQRVWFPFEWGPLMGLPLSRHTNHFCPRALLPMDRVF